MSDDQEDDKSLDEKIAAIKVNNLIRLVTNKETQKVLSEEEAQSRLARLVELKRTNPILYAQEKAKLAAALKVAQPAIVKEVQLLEQEQGEPNQGAVEDYT